MLNLSIVAYRVMVMEETVTSHAQADNQKFSGHDERGQPGGDDDRWKHAPSS